MAYTDEAKFREGRRVVALEAALEWAAEINGYDQNVFVDALAVVDAAGKFEDFLTGTTDTTPMGRLAGGNVDL